MLTEERLSEIRALTWEWQYENCSDHQAAVDDLLRERDALAAVVERLREALEELEGELREYRERLKSPPFHIIEFRDDGFSIQHPPFCRPDLFNCPVSRAAERDLDGPPEEGPGLYVCGVDSEGTFWYEDTPVDVLEALTQGGQE